VLPGVGAFGDCKAGLEAIPGLLEALRTRVQIDKRPFLGVCVGMQLMAERGEERGDHAGLGLVPGVVRRLDTMGVPERLPHMGWSPLHLTEDGRAHPLADALQEAPVYFVHSFALEAAGGAPVLAEADYGGRFPALIGRDNLVGAQFHPERSQHAGLAFLARFLTWTPETAA